LLTRLKSLKDYLIRRT